MSRRSHVVGEVTRARTAPALALALVALAAPVHAQAPAAVESEARRISVSWDAVPIGEVLMAFSLFSGRSIVAGTGVSGFVTASINDKPWDVALRTILSTRGLIGVEDEYGIIRVESIESVNDREAIEPILTRPYRLSFARAEEVQAVLQTLLSPRGSISVSPSTNTVIVSDVARVHTAIAGLIRRP